MEVTLNGNVDQTPVNPFPDHGTYPEVKPPPAPAAAPATPPAGETPPARPAWLPSKFKTPEELAASYAALEMRLGAQPQTPPAGKPPAGETPPATPPPAGLSQADFEKYSKAILSTGALPPEHYAELLGKGIPKEAVDTYIAGQKAIAASLVRDAYDEAGGKEAYIAITEWAKTNLQPEVVKQVKAAFESNDRDLIIGAVKTMKAMHANAGATLPPATSADGTPRAGSQYAPIQTTAELVTLMRSRLYKNDPAFRAFVAKRLEVSNL